MTHWLTKIILTVPKVTNIVPKGEKAFVVVFFNKSKERWYFSPPALTRKLTAGIGSPCGMKATHFNFSFSLNLSFDLRDDFVYLLQKRCMNVRCCECLQVIPSPRDFFLGGECSWDRSAEHAHDGHCIRLSAFVVPDLAFHFLLFLVQADYIEH